MSSTELWQLSATEAVDLQRRGAISAEELVRACLRRIEERETEVAAWEYLDPGLAIAQARACDRTRSEGGKLGLLHGVPVGIKDICDTADMPTAYGSRARLGHRPAIDAVCVAQTRQAGGIIMGKTVTTEFAGRYPGKTSNPHDCRHTPGGSSSGSAAAVADFMVPMATGTQTGGSVIRPSAYCGVFGFKPTFGHLSFEGIHHGAESFDTLGCMARTLDDIRLYYRVLLGLAGAPTPSNAPSPPLRIGFCRTFKWDDTEESCRKVVEGAAASLASAGAQVTEFALPAECAEIYDLAGRLFAVEYARAVLPELRQSPENVSSAIRKMQSDAAAVSIEGYVAGLARIEALKALAQPVLDRFDVVLTPSAGGEAPLGHQSTGPVTFTILWQVLGLPCLTLPVARGPSGLPIGIQIVGDRHGDSELLKRADQIWDILQ